MAKTGWALFLDIFSSLLRRDDIVIAPEEPPVLDIQPKLRSVMTGDVIHTLLKEKFPDASIFISDNYKFLCGMDDIEAFLEQDMTNRHIFVAEAMDCDDFTFMLMGQLSRPGWARLAKFIVWTDKHALLGFIDTNRDFWYLEPQSDKIQSSLEEWQGSDVRIIMG